MSKQHVLVTSAATPGLHLGNRWRSEINDVGLEVVHYNLQAAWGVEDLEKEVRVHLAGVRGVLQRSVGALLLANRPRQELTDNSTLMANAALAAHPLEAAMGYAFGVPVFANYLPEQLEDIDVRPWELEADTQDAVHMRALGVLPFKGAEDLRTAIATNA